MPSPVSETPVSFAFDLEVINASERRIRGVAATDELDRENEIILKSALKDSLKDFLELPVFTFAHKEWPCGLVQKAEINESGLVVEGVIKSGEAGDAVWKSILEDGYRKFSIRGRRVKYSPECRLPPSQRKRPCVTSKLHLDAITICKSELAMNQSSFFEVCKGVIEENLSDSGITMTPDPKPEVTEPAAPPAQVDPTAIAAAVGEEVRKALADFSPSNGEDDANIVQKSEFDAAFAEIRKSLPDPDMIQKAISAVDEVQKALTRIDALEAENSALKSKIEDLAKAVPAKPVYVIPEGVSVDSTSAKQHQMINGIFGGA
jgi:hypothetical protein